MEKEQPWWRIQGFSSDGSFYTPVGGTENTYELTTRGLIDGNEDQATFKGPKNYLEWWKAHFDAGYRRQHTNSTGWKCALHALEIALKPIYQLYGKTPPSFRALQEVHRSSDYDNLASVYLQELYPIEYAARIGNSYLGNSIKLYRKRLRALKRIEDNFDIACMCLLSDQNIDQAAMCIILDLLCRKDGIRIALGKIIAQRKTSVLEFPRYLVQVENGHVHPIEGEDYGIDEIAWVFNDNTEELYEGEVSHWSGIAPSFDIVSRGQSGLVLEKGEMSMEQAMQTQRTKGLDTTMSSATQPPPLVTYPSLSSLQVIDENIVRPSNNNTQLGGPSTAHSLSLKNTLQLYNQLDLTRNPNKQSFSNSPPPSNHMYPRQEASGGSTMSISGYDYFYQGSRSETHRMPSDVTSQDTVGNHSKRRPTFVEVTPTVKRLRLCSGSLNLAEGPRPPKKSVKRGVYKWDSNSTPPKPASHPINSPSEKHQRMKADDVRLANLFTSLPSSSPPSPMQISPTTTEALTSTYSNIPYEPLYFDVQGSQPEGHLPLDYHRDIDYHNVPLPPDQHALELSRALEKSKKIVYNAPSWWSDLPWDLMEEITYEELIIYFPNHVARWPFLALGLRMQNWDRLFYRTVRLINLARQSHWRSREAKHTEVLPFMIKVENSIQQIEPRYQLAEHERWEAGICEEWVWENRKTKPKGFPEKNVQTVTFAEITHYVCPHDFENRPFSRKVRQAHVFPPLEIDYSILPPQPKPRQRKKLTITEDPYLCPNGEELEMREADWTTEEEKESVEVQVCKYGTRCNRIGKGCNKVHIDQRTENSTSHAQAQAQRQGQQHTDDKSNPKIESQYPPNQHSQVAGTSSSKLQSGSQSDSQTSSNDKGNIKPPKQLCRHQLNCKKADCPYAHQSAAAPPNTLFNPSMICKYGGKCTNKTCNRSHESPALNRGGKDGRGRRDEKEKRAGNGGARGNGSQERINREHGQRGGQGESGRNGFQNGSSRGGQGGGRERRDQASHGRGYHNASRGGNERRSQEGRRRSPGSRGKERGNANANGRGRGRGGNVSGSNGLSSALPLQLNTNLRQTPFDDEEL